MDFKNANELLALCEEKNLPISEIMRIREIELGPKPLSEKQPFHWHKMSFLPIPHIYTEGLGL